MPNIIQTKHGVYDVDTIFGCYSYLIRECGLSGDRCAMVNKLYVMANIAELGAEQKRPDGVVELIEACKQFLDIINESRGIDGWHMNGDILLWDQCEQVQMMEDALQKAIAAVGGEHE